MCVLVCVCVCVCVGARACACSREQPVRECVRVFLRARARVSVIGIVTSVFIRARLSVCAA